MNGVRELNEPYWLPSHYPNTIELIEYFKLVEDADLNYPIILCPEGRIMDGVHRVAKAKMLNLLHISALKFELMPTADFIIVDKMRCLTMKSFEFEP